MVLSQIRTQDLLQSKSNALTTMPRKEAESSSVGVMVRFAHQLTMHRGSNPAREYFLFLYLSVIRLHFA